jgi:hypothetical protein
MNFVHTILLNRCRFLIKQKGLFSSRGSPLCVGGAILKKIGIKIAIILGLLIALMIYMNGVKQDRFQQRKQELITNITSNTSKDGIYDIYVFGKGGIIPSEFEKQVDKIHIKYGPIIKNVTVLPYSNTSDTPYVKYFDIVEYPTILVFSSEGIVNRSHSPNELEKFLSKKN